MKTRKVYNTSFHEGDSCNVSSKPSYGERLIEDHPQHLIEDHPQHLIENHHVGVAPAVVSEEPVAAVGAPLAGGGSSHWWAWCLAALVGLFIIGAGLYFGLSGNRDSYKGSHLASASRTGKPNASGLPAAAGGSRNFAGPVQGNVVDYIYYFGNDVAEVTDNSKIEDMAEKIESSGADVVVTAYASTVGDEAYNKRLSNRRAESVANYLMAHGVPESHIKIVPSGETTSYGDEAHNRRANIHVVYPDRG